MKVILWFIVLDYFNRIPLGTDCVATYQQTHPNVTVFSQRAEEVYEQLIEGQDPTLPKPGEVYMLCGGKVATVHFVLSLIVNIETCIKKGPPCQGFSLANSSRQIDDVRNRSDPFIDPCHPIKLWLHLPNKFF